jgi:hypothetical protein
MRSSQGVRQILKTTQNQFIWVEFLIWGYATGYNFLFGGTQSGAILIRGYAITKRLRTPDLKILVFLIEEHLRYSLNFITTDFVNCYSLWHLLFSGFECALS